MFLYCRFFLFLFFFWNIIPSIAFADTEPKQEITITIDLWYRKLFLHKNGQLIKEYPVGVGKETTPTPIGDWKVVEKSRNWGGGFGSCWLGLNVPWGKYGIHGTNKPYSIGIRASHGCVRMMNHDVEQLYPLIPIGTKVRIEGPILDLKKGKLPKLYRGKRGTLVQLVQNRLYHARLYRGEMDGIFGLELEKAVLEFQEKNHLEKSGQIGENEYHLLGLWE